MWLSLDKIKKIFSSVRKSKNVSPILREKLLEGKWDVRCEWCKTEIIEEVAISSKSRFGYLFCSIACVTEWEAFVD